MICRGMHLYVHVWVSILPPGWTFIFVYYSDVQDLTKKITNTENKYFV